MKLTINKLAIVGIACTMLTACASDPRPAVTEAVVDNIPTWMGRMPKDVPPRRGTPEYEAWQARRTEEAARPKDK